jgi:hypothetical protein
MSCSDLRLFSIKDHSSPEATSAKDTTFSFSGYAVYSIALGYVLDVLSTFFSWSETDGHHWRSIITLSTLDFS